MDQGRCPCGVRGSLSMVEAHQVECEVFAAAYRADPASVLTVQEEHARWAASGRREERAAAHAVSVADTDARRAVMADRFKTVDLLED